MLEIENNFKIKALNKQKIKGNDKNEYYTAAIYLSNKFLHGHNLKDPNGKIFNHLIKIFLYFLRYKVYKIILRRNYTEDKGEVLEFKVNLFSNFEKIPDHNLKNTEVISISSFFNNNIKFILI